MYLFTFYYSRSPLNYLSGKLPCLLPTQGIWVFIDSPNCSDLSQDSRLALRDEREPFLST